MEFPLGQLLCPDGEAFWCVCSLLFASGSYHSKQGGSDCLVCYSPRGTVPVDQPAPVHRSWDSPGAAGEDGSVRHSPRGFELRARPASFLRTLCASLSGRYTQPALCRHPSLPHPTRNQALSFFGLFLSHLSLPLCDHLPLIFEDST